MARPPNCDALQELKTAETDGGEPLSAADRRVQPNGRSLYVNLTKLAADIHDIEAGDTVRVETHADGVWISIETGDLDE
ncbi:phage tail protein [Natronomonas sp. F2-12]|uniref:Phage tail protein n=1 Tax=Natronomonas aquatica TaxID=2841590 RepID=A0A9R1CVN2_9EURY|nr:phage tail protein [Natronomonas aquatica]MCQ4334608.1 phage tail protein [Natronomonas aquatica]